MARKIEAEQVWLAEIKEYPQSRTRTTVVLIDHVTRDLRTIFYDLEGDQPTAWIDASTLLHFRLVKYIHRRGQAWRGEA